MTDDISGRILRLPFFNGLDDSSVERIAERFVAAVERTLSS